METPLLIPSFSSKGFAGAGESSEVRQILETASEFLTDVYLISAYDIFHRHLPPPAELVGKPNLIILDSGGYEASGEYDMSEPSHPPVRTRKWPVENLVQVLDDWPAEIPAIFVSYDHPGKRVPIKRQIKNARKLFNGRNDQLRCFLLKQETKTQGSLKDALNSAIAVAEEFTSFDVVGLTEKGLASSPLDRMIAIARLRNALDQAKCPAPIHIFGSLDPVSICLYTLAGAEIFDGLTWLRYAFSNDQCIYPNSHATVEYGIETRDDSQRLRSMRDNYFYLSKLQGNLREFVSTENFSLLPNPEWLRRAYSRFKTRLVKHE